MSDRILSVPRPVSWPPKTIHNELGIATLSLGYGKKHKLEPRLRAAAKAGYKWIDLFDECWEAHLEEHGLNGQLPWEPTSENLQVARKLGDLVKSLGMRIICTQPMRKIEGVKDPQERRTALDLVAKRFPFMRAFDTDMVFMCASIRNDSGATTDLKVVARDLAEMGDMAAAFSKADGGRMLKIGYEGLSWATRNNTWSASWEAVRMANRPNVGVVVDAFNVLAVEWADPYNPGLHGRVYSTLEEAIEILCLSLASMVVSLPAEKIFMFQVGDAECVDPRSFLPPADPETPPLLPWSRAHRLFPFETAKGAYMPVELVAAAVLATGYQGPMSLEIFSSSFDVTGDHVHEESAKRGMVALAKLTEAVKRIPPFWDASREVSIKELVQIYLSNRVPKPSL
jgi:4-hydroxyphenylpyruvate dioxygenase